MATDAPTTDGLRGWYGVFSGYRMVIGEKWRYCGGDRLAVGDGEIEPIKAHINIKEHDMV